MKISELGIEKESESSEIVQEEVNDSGIVDENDDFIEDIEEEEKNSSNLMLGLLDEFKNVYKERLERLENNSLKMDEKEYLQVSLCTCIQIVGPWQ